MWIEKTFDIEPKFVDTLIMEYQSKAINIDFMHNKNSYLKINDWIEEKTNGKIKDMLGELDPATLSSC